MRRPETLVIGPESFFLFGPETFGDWEVARCRDAETKESLPCIFFLLFGNLTSRFGNLVIHTYTMKLAPEFKIFIWNIIV